jgi:hypothetical protein
MSNTRGRRRDKQVKKVEDIYHDLTNPASFSSKYQLLNAIRGTKLKKQNVNEFVGRSDTYQLFKPVKNRFPTRRVYARGPMQNLQGDLMILSEASAAANKPFIGVLLLIDVFSKFVFAEPIKGKTTPVLMAAFKKIFSRLKPMRDPLLLQFDKEGAVFSKIMLNFFEKNKIKVFTTNSTYKASIIERFIRTIRTRIARYMYYHKNLKFIHVLQSIIRNYNRTHHRSINDTPENATNVQIKDKIHENLYDRNPPPLCLPKYSLQDKVRIVKFQNRFTKISAVQTFTQEIFTIAKILLTRPITYQLKDSSNNIIEGGFYENELVLNKS